MFGSALHPLCIRSASAPRFTLFDRGLRKVLTQTEGPALGSGPSAFVVREGCPENDRGSMLDEGNPRARD